MNEVTIVLPPGEEKTIDCVRISELIRKAIYRLLDDLKKISPGKILSGVYRPEGKSIQYSEIQSINYRNEIVWEQISKIWPSEEAVNLTEYIWDHGALKKTITGPKPEKKDWARFIFGELIDHPLLVALESTKRERLIDFGKLEPWEIDKNKIEKAIDDVVNFYCYEKQNVTALCPLSRLNLQSGKSIELASDIKLRAMTTRDVCLLLSRHSHEYHWEDFKKPAVVRDVAEIYFSIKTKISHDVNAMVQDRLDLLKWALFVALDADQPFAEGTCIIKGGLDARMGIFRRDDNMGVDYKIDDVTIQSCRNYIKDFRKVGGKFSDDLKSALWHFGRACVANQQRDILLESAIGLDLLFVPSDPGDSRYRFCLHGSPILSSNKNDGEKLFKELRQIYDNRSKAAHGHKVKEIESLAVLARKKLAAGILRIINLIHSQEINGNDEIAKAVQRYILAKLTSTDRV
jgi:hypothetical protein